MLCEIEYQPQDLNVRIRQHESGIPQIDYRDILLFYMPPEGVHLDMGCGTGDFLRKIFQTYPEKKAFGFDISPLMVSVADSYRNPKETSGYLTVSGADYLPFADNVFSSISANHMLYAVRDIGHVLREVQRVLKPNGKFIVTTNSIEHRNMFFQPRIREILSELKLSDFPDQSNRFTYEDAPKAILLNDFKITHSISIGKNRLIPKDKYHQWFTSLNNRMILTFGEENTKKIISEFDKRLDLASNESGDIAEYTKLGIIVCQK